MSTKQTKTPKNYRILRKPAVCEVTGMRPTLIDELESQGKFPRRLRLSKRAVGWYEHEIDDFLLQLPRANVVGPDPAGNPYRMAKERAAQKGADVNTL